MKKIIICLMAFVSVLPSFAGNKKKIIALTFDDGPNTTTTQQVLDRIEKYKIVASFFLIGNNITSATVPVMKRAVKLGCELDSHSKTHSHMDKLTAEQIKDEMTYTADTIHRVIGKYPKFFRPPYISLNDLMYETIDLPFICGYNATDWDANVTTEQRVKGVLQQAKDGAIILLHDFEGNANTVAALDSIIPALQAQGYQFVTVSQLFKKKHVKPQLHAKVIYSFVGTEEKGH